MCRCNRCSKTHGSGSGTAIRLPQVRPFVSGSAVQLLLLLQTALIPATRNDEEKHGSRLRVWRSTLNTDLIGENPRDFGIVSGVVDKPEGQDSTRRRSALMVCNGSGDSPPFSMLAVAWWLGGDLEEYLPSTLMIPRRTTWIQIWISPVRLLPLLRSIERLPS
ncbi:hypothetical protein Droror1_Dr00011665 [Drosera rotundifolia]